MINHLKKIGKHTAIFSFSGILSKGVGFLLLPLYTRYLSPADYGILELLALMLQISSVLVSQGLPMALFRSYSFDFQKNEYMKTQAVNTAIVYSVITAGIYSGIFFIFAGNIDKILFGSKNYSDLLRIIAITSFFQCITFVPNALLRAKLKTVQISVAQIIHLILNISFNIYFIVVLNLGVHGVIYGNLIAALILALIIYGLIIKDLSFSFSFKILKDMLSFGLPFVPAGLALFVMNGSDRFFLQKFSTTDQVGLYALGYKLSSILQFIVIEPFLLVWPSVYFPLAKEASAQDTLAHLASLFFLAMSFIGLIIILFSKPLIMVMASQAFWDAHFVCAWIVPSVILYGFYNILNVGINIRKKTKITPLIVCIAAIVNLVLNYLLIPKYGMLGAAISTFLSFFIMAVAAYYFNNNIYPVPYQWGLIFKISLFFGSSVFLAYYIKGNSLLIHAARFFIVMGFFLTGLFISALLNKRERESMIKLKSKLYPTFVVIANYFSRNKQ